jgi:hypothetical protein
MGCLGTSQNIAKFKSMLCHNPIPIEVREDIAQFLFAVGVKPSYSSGLGEEITRGYGDLDMNGYWEYPL